MTHPSVNSIVERLQKELLKWWSFNDYQRHTHTWHTRTDFIFTELPKILAEEDVKAATIISELQAQNERKDRLIQAHQQQIIDAGEIMKHWQDRALTAESSLSRIKAETIEEAVNAAMLIPTSMSLFISQREAQAATDAKGWIISAIRALGSTGGGDAEEGSTQKEGSR